MPGDQHVRAEGAPEPADGRAHRSGRRREVLERVREVGRPVGVAQLARDLGLHPNTVRFHLDALLGAGLVRRTDGERGTPGRPALLFAAVSGMDRAGPRRYRQLARALAGALEGVPDVRARALEAGRAWGRAAATASADAEAGGRENPVRALLALVDELDFDPVLLDGDPDRGRRIGLRHCPFLEVATGASAVVCPVHLGLMQGAAQAWGGELSVDRLDPFDEPDLCVAHLSGVGLG